MRFYNGSDMVFEHQSALYLIYATVSVFILLKLHVCSNHDFQFAHMENGVDQLSVTNYNFISDLQWVGDVPNSGRESH